MISTASKSSAPTSLWSSAVRLVAKRKRSWTPGRWSVGTVSARSISSVVAVGKYIASSKTPTLNESNISSFTNIVTPEQAETTALVDGLLMYTRQLMDGHHHHGSTPTSLTEHSDYLPQPTTPTRRTASSQQPSTQATTGSIGRHVVAYSGGIDSSLVLALLHSSQRQNEVVQAVLGVSPAVPREQVALARQVAEHIGALLVEVPTTEGSDDVYIANEGQACLACKTHLYSALGAVALHARSEDRPSRKVHQLYNGTNADDTNDPTRVGLIAARNFHVQSPLLYTTKTQVRRAARHLGLPNWQVAASPCLRSRLALGVTATREHLQRIETAERFVRTQLGATIRETSNLRVRLLARNQARIEVDALLVPHVQDQLKAVLEPFFVQNLNFQSVSLRAFQSGSVAAATSTAGELTQ